MKTLYAIVNSGEGWIVRKDSSYPTKKAYLSDLVLNGYKVRKIYTEDQYNEL